MSDSDTRASDRPTTPEDGITPAMLKAGGEELYSFNRAFEDETDAARRVFEAMMVAKRRKSRKRSQGMP